MKRILSLAIVALLAFGSHAFAATTATFGDYNSSNVYRMAADTSGVITFAQDTGILYPYVASATTNQTLTAAQSGTTVVFNGTANGTQFTLPAATVGMQFTVIADVAKWFYIDPTGSDVINYSTFTAGSRLSNRSSALAGDNITLFCALAGQWSIKNKVGTWGVEP